MGGIKLHLLCGVRIELAIGSLPNPRQSGALTAWLKEVQPPLGLSRIPQGTLTSGPQCPGPTTTTISSCSHQILLVKFMSNCTCAYENKLFKIDARIFFCEHVSRLSFHCEIHNALIIDLGDKDLAK